ncbi:hypothetical protein [Halolamina salifodinae]|uniref:2TM domain-containing protein n=1 Tax=Halolamina salifodinae TaxID=1202767 RepID=A0A8T4GTN3_9EURY|nr:hypothetical protein [Halolamina salifodinae]MBP1986206.1 hypothetical protein [Halolamina salifodinae]
MFVEDEILESIKEDLRESDKDRTEEELKSKLDEYSHATPWLYFETLNLIVWGLMLLYIVYSYVTWINWSHDFWLSTIGFVNIMYVFGWVVDKIYAQKYKSHYPDED